jgi:hypothetical protein
LQSQDSDGTVHIMMSQKDDDNHGLLQMLHQLNVIESDEYFIYGFYVALVCNGDELLA